MGNDNIRYIRQFLFYSILQRIAEYDASGYQEDDTHDHH